MKKKLLSNQGETLTETLVSILVIGLSLMLLMGMMASAAHMNTVAREQDAALSAELADAEAKDAASPTSKNATLKNGSGTTVTFSVDVFGSEDALASYSYQNDGGSGT